MRSNSYQSPEHTSIRTQQAHQLHHGSVLAAPTVGVCIDIMMCTKVFLQIINLLTGIRALAALVRLLASVCAHVRLQSASFMGSIRALTALEWPLTSVRAHVLPQTPSIARSERTLTALEWLVTSMRAHVPV
jgi:hypothetical protein